MDFKNLVNKGKSTLSKTLLRLADILAEAEAMLMEEALA